MKLIFLLIIFSSINAFSKNTYHVEVVSKYGPREYVISAPTDSMALDSVVIGVIYNKRLAPPLSVTVKETGLSTKDLPQRIFHVKTDEKSYRLILNVVDPEYVMTAIQVSKFLMSKTTARDVISDYDDTTLKSRPATKYTVKFNSKIVSYLVNTNNIEQGEVAMDIAARLSPLALEYQATYTKPVTCASIFLRYY